MKPKNLLLASAALLSVAALVSACSSDRIPDGSGGSGGADGSGSGGAATGGTGGTGGIDCPQAPAYVIHAAEGGAGGAEGRMSFLCYPNVVCFGPDVLTPEFYPVTLAYAHVGADGDANPVGSAPTGNVDVAISAPTPDRVCLKGSDGAGLGLTLGDPEGWDGEGPPYPQGTAPVPWDELGITHMRFTLENPPPTGASVGYFPFVTCGNFLYYTAEVNGNPLLITESGETTLELASAFGPDFVLHSGAFFDIIVSAGEYDYCIKDLEFLNADGERVGD